MNFVTKVSMAKIKESLAYSVIPAKGRRPASRNPGKSYNHLDSRFRGNDEIGINCNFLKLTAFFVVTLCSVPAFADKPAPASAPLAVTTAPVPDYQAGAVAYDAGDYAKALRIWQPLAEKGDTRAQRAMGKMYEKGRGVERDFATAIKWYRPAAEKGDAESQYRLSVGYGYGLGVKQDEAKAMEWLRKAAENGQKRAQRSLAKGYEDGLKGLPRDPEKAKYWYDRSRKPE